MAIECMGRRGGWTWPGWGRLAGRGGGILSVVFVVLVGASPALAQSGHIMGRVVSDETGEPILGAHVQVEEVGAGALTDTEGQYMIRGVAEGAYTVIVQVIGFEMQVVSGVAVASGKFSRLDVTLSPEAVALGDIRVNAVVERGSAVALLNERQRSTAMVDATGREQIARTPDSDAAEAIKRVSGVSVQDGRYVFVRGLGERYTTASLNGARIPSPEPERRVVPLDLFPTGLLETITTTKTFTPDRPGDFSGARIDLRTRAFPAERQVTVSASTGYHPEVTGRSWTAPPMEPLDWLALGAGARQIPDQAAGFASASRGPEVNEVVNSFRNVWSVQDGAAPPSGSFGVSVGGSDHLLDRNIGYLLSGSYSAGAEMAFDQRRALAGADGTEYNRYDGQSGRYGVIWGGLANVGTELGGHTRIDFTNSYNRTADNEARIEVGTDEDTNARVQVERLQYTERAVRSNQLRVSHELSDRHQVRWSATSSGVERYEPDRSEFVTWLDPEVPIWFKHEEGAMRSFGGLHESSYEAALDYELHLGPPTNPHRLLLGGHYRGIRRAATSQVFRIQPFNWSESDERWQGEPEAFFDGRHSQNGEGNFILARDRSGGNYSAQDRIRAAYVMADVGVGSRLRLVGGARVERSDLVLDYESQLGSTGSARPGYTDVLPSLALTLELTGDQQLRLSASQTLARPEYREIAPIAYREVLGGEQVIGNADLERTLIRNLDARWEWYPSRGEAMSIGVFAKDFRGPVEQRFLGRSGTDTRTFENAESAFNYGLELELTRGLGFLGAPLHPLSLFSNITLMRSEVESGRPEDERRPMVGQAPYVVNAGLAWTPSASGYSAAILYNVVGPRIVNARASGTGVDDVIEQPRPGLDLSLRFPLPGGMDGKLDLKNLLDSPNELRQGEAVRQYHRTGRSASFGLTWRPWRR